MSAFHKLDCMSMYCTCGNSKNDIAEISLSWFFFIHFMTAARSIWPYASAATVSEAEWNIYIYINIVFLLIFNKHQPTLHPGHTCLGLGGVPQTDCSVADPGKRHGGPGGPGLCPFIFRPNWGPKGWKNFLIPLLPPYLRVWMNPPPLSEGVDLPLWFHCNKQSSIAIASNTP